LTCHQGKKKTGKFLSLTEFTKEKAVFQTTLRLCGASGGSELTFRSDLLLTARGSST
jgi:hypothetical protein